MIARHPVVDVLRVVVTDWRPWALFAAVVVWGLVVGEPRTFVVVTALLPAVAYAVINRVVAWRLTGSWAGTLDAVEEGGD